MTSQSRRKHGACLSRVRENCPFRKLKRNDSTSTLVPTGGHWRTLETPPQAGASGSDCGINRAVSVETFSRPPQSDSHVQEEFSAMDTDMDPPTSSGYSVSDAPGPSSLIINQLRHMSSIDIVMDLDSGVDPETGEQAQGWYHCGMISNARYCHPWLIIWLNLSVFCLPQTFNTWWRQIRSECHSAQPKPQMEHVCWCWNANTKLS